MASDIVGRRVLAELYRVGRIHRHVTSEDAVSLEVDLPRRLLTRFDDVRVDA